MAFVVMIMNLAVGSMMRLQSVQQNYELLKLQLNTSGKVLTRNSWSSQTRYHHHCRLALKGQNRNIVRVPRYTIMLVPKLCQRS